jgi:hypothetical protein
MKTLIFGETALAKASDGDLQKCKNILQKYYNEEEVFMIFGPEKRFFSFIKNIRLRV